MSLLRFFVGLLLIVIFPAVYIIAHIGKIIWFGSNDLISVMLNFIAPPGLEEP